MAAIWATNISARASEVNFVDLDFGMVGPVVRDASASFDRYWNSPSAYPLELLHTEGIDPHALGKMRQRLATQADETKDSRYAQALRGDAAIQRLASGAIPMEWSGNYQFIADDPLKITMKKRDAHRAAVSAVLLPAMRDCEVGARCHLSVFRSGRQRQHGAGEHRA